LIYNYLIKKINLEQNIWTQTSSREAGEAGEAGDEIGGAKIWKGYKLTASSTNNTFDYIFNKFKKGIYVRIENNIRSNGKGKNHNTKYY
jgi:hypothetical protein